MPAGRPTKYKPEYAEQARHFALLGLADVDMAKQFEVEEKTFYTWKNKHKEFLQALKEGKEQADSLVAASLYQRATGLKVEEVTDRDGVVTRTVKELPPDTGAAMAWLKNRQPQLWRDNKGIVEDALAVLLTGIMDTSRGLPSQQAIEGELEQKDG